MYTFGWDRLHGYIGTPTFVVVGCGGTGSLVAEGLCRLLHGAEGNIFLVDHDRVEEHNLGRQNFYSEDLGEFKSKALANRLARKYGRKLGYCVLPYSKEFRPEFSYTWARSSVVIGCVDNPHARRSIAESLTGGLLWIDAGNGEVSGQVLIGDTMTPEHLEGSFTKLSICQHLPAPSLQEPGLLLSVEDPQPVDCAVSVEQGDQSPVINQAMATMVLQVVSKLMENKLSWMGVYINLELGHMRPVFIDPEGVSRLIDIPTKKLIGA